GQQKVDAHSFVFLGISPSVFLGLSLAWVASPSGRDPSLIGSGLRLRRGGAKPAQATACRQRQIRYECCSIFLRNWKVLPDVDSLAKSAPVRPKRACTKPAESLHFSVNEAGQYWPSGRIFSPSRKGGSA